MENGVLSVFGAGVGRGIAIGKAYVLRSSELNTAKIQLGSSDIKAEITRFKQAICDTDIQYQNTLKQLPKNAQKESAAFIQAHRLMLKDPLLVNESIKIIQHERVNAEYAVQQQAENLIRVFEQMQDSYLRNKKNDVQHITKRLLRNLTGVVTHNLDEYNTDDLSGKIIVAKDVSPAETMFIKERKVAAFVTDFGGQISHTAIVARSLKLPAVMSLKGCTRYISDDELIIVDSKRGIVIVNPPPLALKQYRTLQRKIQGHERVLQTLVRKKTQTIDKQAIQLLANIENRKELTQVKKANAAGIGLYRTEYLFMNRDSAPCEEEQFQAYKHIASRLKNKPVTIRTLDIGGDKQLDFNYPHKESSASPLGLRAVRLCLYNIDLFVPQLRAILRASAYGNIALLIPMLSNLEEVDQVLYLIEQTKLELKQQKIKYNNRIKIGGMIEVPGAALLAHLFAKKLDFFSIGTNDLIQYTLAIDRIDNAVNYLYDPIHPAVLKLIHTIIKAGERYNIPVSLCGEMAGNINFTRLLLGMGLKTFSMDATYLLDVKERILSTDTNKVEYKVKQILSADSMQTAHQHLASLNRQ